MELQKPDTLTHRQRGRMDSRKRFGIAAAVSLAVVGTIAAAIGYQAPASPSTADASPADVAVREQRSALPPPGERRGEARPPPLDPGGSRNAGSRRPGAMGEGDGILPEGTTVFEKEIPGVDNLDRSLIGALRRAADKAADDGVELFVSSGWRSPEYQERLLEEAVSTYGSEEEAARWVATPGTSSHVSGEAVDIGPLKASAWLSEKGARYDLCQIYRNEPWHFELRPGASDHGCPPLYADAARDPRMRP